MCKNFLLKIGYCFCCENMVGLYFDGVMLLTVGLPCSAVNKGVVIFTDILPAKIGNSA